MQEPHDRQQPNGRIGRRQAPHVVATLGPLTHEWHSNESVATEFEAGYFQRRHERMTEYDTVMSGATLMRSVPASQRESMVFVALVSKLSAPSVVSFSKTYYNLGNVFLCKPIFPGNIQWIADVVSQKTPFWADVVNPRPCRLCRNSINIVCQILLCNVYSGSMRLCRGHFMGSLWTRLDRWSCVSISPPPSLTHKRIDCTVGAPRNLYLSTVTFRICVQRLWFWMHFAVFT